MMETGLHFSVQIERKCPESARSQDLGGKMPSLALGGF